jgi:O-antigen ligase
VLAYPGILSAFLITSLLWQRLNRIIWGGGPQNASNLARQAQWSMLWPKLGRWPLGNGAGQSGDALGYANGAGIVTVDSYYITLLMEYGVLGAITFFGLIGLAAYQAYSLSGKAQDRDMRLMLPVFVMLVNFVIIKGVLSGDDIHAMIFMSLGMVVAMTYRHKMGLVGKA